MVAVQPDSSIACSIQSLFYGVYVVSFFHCLRWLVFGPEGRKLRPKIHWPITTVTVALFVLMTSNVVMVFLLMMLSLGGNSGLSAYITTYNVAAGIGVTILLIVDGVLIYRCWTIYRNSWLTIILPLVFLWTADLGSAIAGIILLALNSGWPSPQQQNSARYRYWLSITYTIYFVCEIIINLFATSAIVLQIIRVTRWDGRRNSGRLYQIGLILVESGILFTITSVLSLCLKLMAAGMGKFRVSSVIMNVINLNTAALTFNLILIRIEKERPQPSESSQDANKTTVLLTTVQFSASTSGQTSQPESELP